MSENQNAPIIFSDGVIQVEQLSSRSETPESVVFMNGLEASSLEFKCIRSFYKANGDFMKTANINTVSKLIVESYLSTDPEYM